MKIFTEWIEEQHASTYNDKEVACEVALTFKKMTPEIEALIRGISRLHKQIFKKEDGYKTKYINDKKKVKDINEAYRTSNSGITKQLWNTTLQ